MKTLSIPFPTTVRDLLAHPSWDGFISDKLGNDLFINDPERAERNYDAAEHGCDGSTHAEHIEDWREFAEVLERDAHRSIDCETDAETDAAEIAIEQAAEALETAIAECEDWHEKNGSLHTEIG